MKINSNFRLFASTNFDSTKYIESPAYGVNRFMLDRIGNEKARATTIVEYKPNSKFPKHTHIGGEEFLVLEGTFKDQYGIFPAGTYVRNPIGTEHEPWVDDDGCTIMVKLLQMADIPNGEEILHINLEQAKIDNGKMTTYGTIVDLYKNEHTGEHVEMCWLNPNVEFPINDKCSGGEELFIFSGSLHFQQCNENEEVYDKWGWMRFPAFEGNNNNNNNRSTLKAGNDGAQVYRKTGHLTENALSMEKIQINIDDESVSIK